MGIRYSDKDFAELQEKRSKDGKGAINVAGDTSAKRKPKAKRSVKSKAEESLNILLAAWELPEPVREYRFHEKRMWRFDFAWPDHMVALEVEGILFGDGGRHQRGQGFANDCVKYLHAQHLGWLVVRVPSTWLSGGYSETMNLVEQVLRTELGLEKE